MNATRHWPLLLFVFAMCTGVIDGSRAVAELRAGAAAVDVTPSQFPVLVNGGMTSRTADGVNTPLFARAICLDDGNERLAIVVVDSCMMPRTLLDEAKQLAAERTKIEPDRILISATHTHSAPSCMGALGTDADQTYIPYLREKLAEAIASAEANLEPARVGWAVGSAPEYTALRRWIRRPDRVALDPFGNPTVRANMHAAGDPDNVIGESGPEDPDLSVISLVSPEGRPIALLANFSMHYFSGERPLSADYFGLFCDGLEKSLGHDDKDAPPFVAIMSHGCSGDIWRRDYRRMAEGKGQRDWTIDEYAAGLQQITEESIRQINYRDADLTMEETRMELPYRVPNQQLLEWSQRVVQEMGDRPPKTQPEVYAVEQLILHEKQSTEVCLQAVRIGDIGIVTTPNETYALTGLKLKLQSPLPNTMVIELANGGDGYIPPPEQHLLGGYNTWAARSAGLETMAEPKITAAGLRLLEEVAGRQRRTYVQSQGNAAQAINELEPIAYWRLDEFDGLRAKDSSGQQHDAIYEPAVAFFLDGPHADRFNRDGETNRCAHFAGGRLNARLSEVDGEYSISLWFWNGMPNEGRDVTGWIYSRGFNHGVSATDIHVGISGTAHAPGRLMLQFDQSHQAEPVVGESVIERWTWNQLTLVCRDGEVVVYLNGELELSAECESNGLQLAPTFFFGGRCDHQHSFEGRLDEIAVFDRPLSEDEIKALTSFVTRSVSQGR